MTLFFREYVIYKPDIKTDEEFIVDKVTNCENNCFHTFNFEFKCDVKIKDIKNKKIINREIGNDGLRKKRIEMILAPKKNLRFTEIDKLKIKCWGDLRDNNIRYYMSLKIPFIIRLFFQKIAHNREYVNNYCNNLDNEYIFFVVDGIKKIF